MSTNHSVGDSMDNYLSQSIEGLRGSMESGFERVERRMDSMVSRDAFNAEVARLNQRDDHLEERFSSGLEELEVRVDSGFAGIERRELQREERARARDEARDVRFARRMTWSLAVVGLLWTVAQFFVAPLLR